MDTASLFYEPKEKSNWYTNFILTIPSLTFSLWCVATTTYTALVYEHIKNILRNVTIHIEI